MSTKEINTDKYSYSSLKNEKYFCEKNTFYPGIKMTVV